MEDFVCLGNEGLRDPSTFKEYMQLSKELRRVDARLPTYANLLEGRDIDEIAAISHVTDLVVVAPPIDVLPPSAHGRYRRCAPKSAETG